MPAALEIKIPLNPPRSVLFFLGGRTGDPKQGGENCDADGEQNNHDHTFSMNRPPRAKRKMKPSATDYGLWACHAKAAIAFAAVNKYEARRDQPAGGNRRATRLNQPPGGDEKALAKSSAAQRPYFAFDRHTFAPRGAISASAIPQR